MTEVLEVPADPTLPLSRAARAEISSNAGPAELYGAKTAYFT